MIEINLLPQELRKRQINQFTLPKKYLNSALLLVIAVIAITHILIQGLIVSKGLMYASAEKRMRSIQPQKQIVEEMRSAVQKYKTLEDISSRLSRQRLAIAPVLNYTAHSIPQGVWLTQLSLTKEGWELRGSCVSAAGSEMAQIGKFLQALKQDAQMRSVFAKLELASVQRKKVGPTEVVEFIISSKKQAAGSKKK